MGSIKTVKSVKKPRKKVLLVGSNAEEVLPISEKLQSAKNPACKVIPAGTLEEALKRLAAGDIDAVMLDLILPDSRGRETFMRVHSRFPEVPVIILTGAADEELAIRLVQEGAQDYLVKGLKDENLPARAVNYALERSSLKKAGKEALERMREMDELKSQFVAEASHEIRSPLNFIREFVALVHDGVIGALNEKQRSYLGSALRNCDKLTSLINHILDLARIEAGRKDLRFTKVDMAALLAQCRNDYLTLFKSKNQTFQLDVPAALPPAHCDLNSVQNILANLIDNAHKFAPEGGAIRVVCREEGKFLRVAVEDNGPGMPPEKQEKVFKPFGRLDSAGDPDPKGGGLGLKIAKSLVEMNGGTIAVKSRPGKGSSFSFTLPVHDRQIPSRILIVDDEEAMIKLIEDILKHADFNLEVKSTLKGLNSLVVAGEFKPDLVILDMYLDDVDGKEVLASLKQVVKNSCKVLMISGDPTIQDELKKWGTDDFLPKPFSAEDILSRIRNLLGYDQKGAQAGDLPAAGVAGGPAAQK